MLLKNVYERVILLGSSMPAASFVAAFNHFSDYLLAKYDSDRVCAPESNYSPAVTLDSDVAIRPEYEGAFVDHIIGVSKNDPDKMADGVAKAELAYRAIWRRDIKGKRIKRERWY